MKAILTTLCINRTKLNRTKMKKTLKFASWFLTENDIVLLEPSIFLTKPKKLFLQFESDRNKPFFFQKFVKDKFNIFCIYIPDIIILMG